MTLCLRLEFESVGFHGEEKNRIPGEKPVGQQRREPTTHIWGQLWDVVACDSPAYGTLVLKCFLKM